MTCDIACMFPQSVPHTEASSPNGRASGDGESVGLPEELD